MSLKRCRCVFAMKKVRANARRTSLRCDFGGFVQAAFVIVDDLACFIKPACTKNNFIAAVRAASIASSMPNGVRPRRQPPVICVHGLTRNGRDFDYLARALEGDGRQVFCPDIVGRGKSDWLANPADYNTHNISPT